HHDVADHPGYLHGQLVRNIDRIDDPDYRGVDRAILQPRRHAGRAPAHHEHRLADARIHRIDGDEVVAVGLAARIHRAHHQQLAADEAWILTRGDDGANDFCEEHRGSGEV